MGRGKTFYINVGAVILVVLGAFMLGRVFSGYHKRNKGPGNSFGTILIDSPEIYTRERLVNDRFREDAWLKSTLKNLKKLSEEKFGFQGVSLTQLSDRTTMELDLDASGQTSSSQGSATQAESQGGRSGARDEPEKGRSSQNDNVQLRAQLRDDFRQILDIRDAIRKEIIENQLDDRHDIGVNTLYNFKFDVTTIVPGNDTSAWAKIRIKIHKSKRQELVDALIERYKEWIDYLEALVNKEFQKRALKVNSTPTEHGFTHDEIKELKNDLLEYLIRNANLFPESTLSEEDKTKIVSLVDHLTTPDQKPIDKQFNPIIARLLHENFLPFTLQSRQQAMSWLVARWVIFELLERPGLNRFVTTNITPVGEENLCIAVETYRGPSTIQEGFEFEAQQVDKAEIDKTSGYVEFLRVFLHREYEIFTYSVSPKQSVERVSDAAAYERSYELLSSLVASQEPANVKAALKLLREQNADIRAIRSNAVIVGFADHHREEPQEAEAVFGWLIGPRFQISDDGTGFQYRHIPTQNALSVLVSLPSVWNEVDIEVQTSWLREDAMEHDKRSYSYPVSLPADVDKLTEAVATAEYGTGGSKPQLIKDQMSDIYLTIGEPAQVLIRGQNLWRSTVVTIGSQASDRITVLPNMEGIIAHFNEFLKPSTEKPMVRVWTSTGMILLPQEVKYSHKRDSDQEPTAQ